MITFIEVIKGPNEGSRYKAVEGITLGRSEADIIFEDPKISSTHAKFALDAKGALILMDLDSSNGIRIGGRRVKKVSLLQGVTFEIGRTQFKVIVLNDDVAIDLGNIMSWRDILRNKLSRIELGKNYNTAPLHNFSPALRLLFIQGIQADKEIILGYGPRQAGSSGLDIELLDEKAPADAFEFVQVAGSVEIKVADPGRIKINGKALDSKILNDGDLISFGNTVIKVNYI